MISLYTWYTPNDILASRPALARWLDDIAQRPAVRRGANVPGRA